jgi:hypothetical protein
MFCCRMCSLLRLLISDHEQGVHSDVDNTYMDVYTYMFSHLTCRGMSAVFYTLVTWRA